MNLFIIIFYSLVIRLWRLSTYPSMVNGFSLNLRLSSVLFSILSGIIIYYYINLLHKNKKVALLTTWIFYTIPWTIEQSRIASSVNLILFIFLSSLLLTEKYLKNRYLIIIIQTLFLLLIFLGTHNLLGSDLNYSLNFRDYLRNIFSISSFYFLFFSNSSYWWGGIREYGILFLSFLPFFILGSYYILLSNYWNIIRNLVLIILLTGASSIFPEGRGFYLATPFLSLIIANGLNNFYKMKFTLNKIIILIFLFIFSFEMANFWHFYVNHYSQEIYSNRSHLNGKF